MADRYISREWLLKELSEYKNLKTWNTEVCDPDTIQRVLQVVENLVNGAPSIGPRQYGNKELAAKKAALNFQLSHLKVRCLRDGERYAAAEKAGSFLVAGLYMGRCQVEEEMVEWLERMVKDG